MVLAITFRRDLSHESCAALAPLLCGQVSPGGCHARAPSRTRSLWFMNGLSASSTRRSAEHHEFRALALSRGKHPRPIRRSAEIHREVSEEALARRIRVRRLRGIPRARSASRRRRCQSGMPCRHRKNRAHGTIDRLARTKISGTVRSYSPTFSSHCWRFPNFSGMKTCAPL